MPGDPVWWSTSHGGPPSRPTRPTATAAGRNLPETARRVTAETAGTRVACEHGDPNVFHAEVAQRKLAIRLVSEPDPTVIVGLEGQER